MDTMNESRAQLVDQLDHFVAHANIDHHLSCGINSAFEVDELLLQAANCGQEHHSLRQSELVRRLGMISAA